jgi:hypothetical protein
MLRFILFTCILFTGTVQAQIFQKKEEEKRGIRLPKYVATKNTYGMIAGIERGQYTFMELGAEKHWKKIRLVHARTVGANANLEYNFGNNILGYNAAAWVKTGRVDLTYGVNLNYITDFEISRYGLGPQIGFRLLGLHFVNGYNFLLGNKELTQVNKFYVGLRYYFPLRSKTTVVNVNKRKPSEKDKQKEKEKTKASEGKVKQEGGLFRNPSNKQGAKAPPPTKSSKTTRKGKKNEPEIEEKKNILDIFKKKQPDPPPGKKSKREQKKSEQSKKDKAKNKKEPKKRSFWDYFRNNE